MSGWQVAALIVAAWFSLCACLLCGWMAWVTLADISHRRRRGGYLRRSVFEHMKDGGARPRETATTARISSYSPPGDRSEAPGIRARLAPPSRPTGPIAYGFGTVDRGASGGHEPAPPAGSLDAAFPPWPTGGIVL